MALNLWHNIRNLVGWLNENDYALTQPGQRRDDLKAQRLLKLAEEVGEVSQAYIGMTGQNPRKRVTHTGDDVAKELCDVIVTAMVALCDYADDPERFLEHRVEAIVQRAGLAQHD